MSPARKDVIKLQFGGLLRKRRKRQGLSQELLAHQAGLDRTYISGIERGVRNPTLTVLYRIAQGLGLTVSGLLADLEKEVEGENR